MHTYQTGVVLPFIYSQLLSIIASQLSSLIDSDSIYSFLYFAFLQFNSVSS